MGEELTAAEKKEELEAAAAFNWMCKTAYTMEPTFVDDDDDKQEEVPDIRKLPRQGGSGFDPLWIKTGNKEAAKDLARLSMEEALAEYQKRLGEKDAKAKLVRDLQKQKEASRVQAEHKHEIEKLNKLTDHELLIQILLELRKNAKNKFIC